MATTGELASVAEHVRAFYRATGALSGDDALIEQGEVADDVVYLALTRGFRACQRWLIDQSAGERWRKRSAAITTWSGSETTDGGRYVNLASGSAPTAIATDFMRLDGDQTGRSALVQADGTPWGREVPADDDWRRGDYYYLAGDRLWLTRSASPPSTLYLRYYYSHPAISSATTTFDMAVDLRWLCIAEAVSAAVNEAWVPSGADGVVKSDRALEKAREEARRTLRRTREPRRMQGPQRYASHW